MKDIYIPTRSDIESFKEGDLAPDCFGNWKKITKVFARGVDANDRAYVCYYTEFGNTAGISNSLKEGRIHRSVALSERYTSHELDVMELRFANLAEEVGPA